MLMYCLCQPLVDVGPAVLDVSLLAYIPICLLESSRYFFASLVWFYFGLQHKHCIGHYFTETSYLYSTVFQVWYTFAK